MKHNIQHDEKKQCFYLEIENQVAELNYKKVDDHTLDYRRTFVPVSLRNQGIASKLVRYALEFSKNQNYSVIPSCPFVKKYIEDHSEYSNLIRS